MELSAILGLGLRLNRLAVLGEVEVEEECQQRDHVHQL